MSSPFVAEIRIFGFDFAPTGWAQCDGQILPLSQNTALFSLLGTTYGGNGLSTFALPDLQGMVPIQAGQGPGLSLYDLGQTSGSDAITLLQTEIASHSHTPQASTALGNRTTPVGNSHARVTGATPYVAAQNLVAMAATSVGQTGGSLPHNNLMPYLTLNFCIALQGIFPPRG